MKADPTPYKQADSDARIREILASSDYEYEDKYSVPSRDGLTFTNGFYVNCSAMFVDMRDSKKIADKYKRPTMARIYRAYISELVALFRGNSTICEIMIEGDCVWGIFDTKLKADIDTLLCEAARVISLERFINWHLFQRSIDPITVGVGLDYGRALMIKGGYQGSGVNDVVWMGEVVSSAAKLCSFGSKLPTDYPVMLSDIIYNNLSEASKRLVLRNPSRGCYHANIVDSEMEEWLRQRKGL